MTTPGFDPNAFVQQGQERVAAQQQALMQVIAQQGAAGAQAYAQAAEQVGGIARGTQAQMAGNMKGSAIEDPAYAQAQNARMTAIHDLYQGDLATGRASFEADMARQQSSNAQYMGEVSAALPVMAGDIQREAQALTETARRIKERQAHEAQMRQMELQIQREQLAGAREARAGRGRDNRTPEEIEMDRLRLEGMRRELAAPTPDERARLKAEAAKAFADIDREHNRLGHRAKVAYTAMKERGMSPEQLMRDGFVIFDGKRVKVGDLDYRYLGDLLRRADEARFRLAQFAE